MFSAFRGGVNLKIRTKITVGFLIILVMMWVISGIFYITSYIWNENFNFVRDTAYPSRSHLTEVEMAVNNLELQVYEYIVMGLDDSIVEVELVKDDLESSMAGYLEHEELINATHVSFDEKKIEKFIEMSQAIIDKKARGMSDVELLEEIIELEAYCDTIIFDIEKHQDDMERMLNKATLAVAKSNSYGKGTVLSATVMSTIVVIVIMFLTSKTIKRALMHLKEGIARIKKGELDFRMEVDAVDELNEIVAEINHMAGKLSLMMVSKEHLHNILDTMADAVIVTDMDERITYVNKSTSDQLGYASKQCVGNTPLELFLGREYTENYYVQIGKLFSGEKTAEEEYLIKRQDGSQIPVAVNIALLRDSDGDPDSIIAVSRDISKLKEAEVELRKAKKFAEDANQAKSQYLTNMSNELRTSINGILGMSDLLIKYDSENLTQEQVEGVELINASGHRLSNLLNEILELSMAEAGKLKIGLGPLSTAELVKTVEMMFESIYKNTYEMQNDNLEFIIQKKDTIPEYIVSDEKRINEILGIIIENSIRYTHEGKIEFSMYDEGERLYFILEDTGPGIRKEELKDIFNKFKHMKEAVTARYEAVGLGLSLCKELVELLKGEIAIESTEGVGTTVKFYIPLTEFEESDVKVNQDYVGYEDVSGNLDVMSDLR